MKRLLLFAVMAASSLSLVAQRHKCSTMERWNRITHDNPEAFQRMDQLNQEISNLEKQASNRSVTADITIPVVFHVIYHTSTENISAAQIQSQLDVLNRDFRLLNSDSLATTHPFWQFTADTKIEFCMAKQDASGLPTDGITRTFTDSLGFIGEDNEKYTASGGRDNWDPTKYLNIWVANLNGSGGTLGYAAFPSDLATDPGADGVVIDFRAFGTTGTAGTDGFPENDGGRTATHEVGHWLNLFHIWGDATCGDDLVADTRVSEMDNYGTPTFPHNPNSSCTGSDADGEMYMNYMDYVDDVAMNMFTVGQANRMRAALNASRSGLASSLGCTASTNIEDIEAYDLIRIVPNPTSGFVTFQNVIGQLDFSIYNLLGKKVMEVTVLANERLNLEHLPSGVYSAIMVSGGNKSVQKLVIK